MRPVPFLFWMLLVLLTGLASGCATRAPSTSSHAAAPGSIPDTYVVRRDDTLYRIATQHGLDWRDVARRNGIGPPFLIHPGQRIRLAGAAPMTDRPAPVASAPAARPAPPPAAPTRHAPSPPVAAPSPRPAPAPGPVAATAPSPRPAPAAAPVAATAPPQWQWPSDGPVIRAFSNSAMTRRGIAIGGQRGDDVRAASSGEVVYAGSGLVGYGRLIILKHDARFISAYGHNQELLVREGQTVRAGERIALLGDSGADRPMLHFEIRLDGAPVDPTRYLPRR
jgi:lipoprotein NlpD